MAINKRDISEIPMSTLEHELDKIKYKNKYIKEFMRTIYTLLIVASIAILLSTLFFPVLRISGNSMLPLYEDNDLVLVLNGKNYSTNDIIVFHYNKNLLVKRIIAIEGQWVDIDKDGNVYIDEVLLEEDYVIDKALGECDIEMPYQVPSGKFFVMGDHRSTSVDSRVSEIGCVENDKIVGKILLSFGF